MTTPVHVVGIGLEGAAGLTDDVRQTVLQATLLVGSERHLSYFPNHPAERLVLKDLAQMLDQIRWRLSNNWQGIVILVSGDPLFFGLGRLLVAELAPEHLTFHPHLSAVQLAFNRLKIPWQDARLISAHGRCLDELAQALKQSVEKIAILTDATNTPSAIARLFFSLNLPTRYQFWVCQNLGGAEEKIQALAPEILAQQTFAPLNVVIMLRTMGSEGPLDLKTLPLLGLPDRTFLSFADRPGLMTKREVRVLALTELALQPGQIVWDLGAGTGSVSIEIARLSPQLLVYAVEKAAAGTSLIQQNCQRLQVENVISIHGSAPEVLQELPDPDRIFIGGSGGKLNDTLNVCQRRLNPGGIMVIALATLEHLNTVLSWSNIHQWQYQVLQVQLSRSIAVGALTRLDPLNPVTLVKVVCPNC